jgi:hypothetical protein
MITEYPRFGRVHARQPSWLLQSQGTSFFVHGFRGIHSVFRHFTEETVLSVPSACKRRVLSSDFATAIRQPSCESATRYPEGDTHTPRALCRGAPQSRSGRAPSHSLRHLHSICLANRAGARVGDAPQSGTMTHTVGHSKIKYARK